MSDEVNLREMPYPYVPYETSLSALPQSLQTLHRVAPTCVSLRHTAANCLTMTWSKCLDNARERGPSGFLE